METIWIEEPQLSRALLRNEAFWNGELEGGPLLWITVPGAKRVPPVPEPARDEELWTNVLSALRGPENLAMDLVQHPAAIERAMDLVGSALDPKRLFIWATASSVETAEEIVRYGRRAF